MEEQTKPIEEKKDFIEKLKQFSAPEIIGIFVAIFLIGSCAYMAGQNSKVDKLAVETVSQRKIESDSELQSKKTELADINGQIEQVKGELSSQQDVLNEFNDYKANKEAKEGEIVQLDNDIQAKSNGVAKLAAEIQEKSSELDQLKNAIQRTGEEPKVLPAGEYTVGYDIDAGRYIVTGRSNFVVHSATGRLKVNTILGGGSYGEESYTCTLETGDSLELSSKDTFTPIK